MTRLHPARSADKTPQERKTVVTNLVTASPATLASIGERSKVACVVFANHPLPAGAVPKTGDIGIEQTDSSTLLHVHRGLQYEGPDDEVRNWMATGTKSFPSLTDCMHWLRRHLPEPPDMHELILTAAQPSFGRLPVDRVTELDKVHVERPPAPTPEALEAVLAQQILGQESAIRGLAEMAAYHIAKPYPRRPASALLIGATGTGKTLAAEQLALHLTSLSGSEWSYQRLDMNEFAEKHTASHLFGAPPGYIGYDDGHDLATALRANPRTVVVLDEIDKAHPQLWRSLMNLMDAGRLRSQGRDLDARQSVLIFTSNKDATAIQPLARAQQHRLRVFLRDHQYPPEIVARLGRILVFVPLPNEVATKLMVLTVQRVVESYGLQLAHIAPEAVTDLASRAPQRSSGRDVEYFVEHQLAKELSRIAHGQIPITIAANLSVSVPVTPSLRQPDLAPVEARPE